MKLPTSWSAQSRNHCPVREMGRAYAQFMNWAKCLPISWIGQLKICSVHELGKLCARKIIYRHQLTHWPRSRDIDHWSTYTEFEVSICIRYEDRKGDAKSRKMVRCMVAVRGHSRVTENSTIRQNAYEFLLAFYRNFVPILIAPYLRCSENCRFH